MSQLIAFIREAECIGCAKCIPACPFDAILGAPKYLHTVINDLCTGCKLCVAPCPVDCIEMRPLENELSKNERTEFALKAKARYQKRQARLMKQKSEINANKKILENSSKKSAIEEAVKRAKQKNQ